MKKEITKLLQRVWRERTGFTLLEMIVSVGLFAVLVLSVINIMLEVSKTQAKATNIQAIQDNIRFSMELFEKELRTGYNYQAISQCGSAGLGLQFTNINQGNEAERFYYLADINPTDGIPETIMRVAMNTTDPPGVINCAKAIQFTAGEVEVTTFHIDLYGATAGPNDGQPRVSISMEARAKNPKLGTDTTMSIQTTITQRFRDF